VIRLRITAVAICTLLILASRGPLACAQAVTGPKLAVVGDSLSVGLAGALPFFIPRVQVESYGIVSSGLDIPGIADWQARIRMVAATHPDFAMVMIGMNDSRGPPDLVYLKKLVNFLSPLEEASIPYVVVAIPTTTQPKRNINIDKFNAVFSALAPRLGGRFIALPLFSPTERTPDGIHFTRIGYHRLAGNVLFSLQEMLQARN
jgi:hypothetical protein